MAISTREAYLESRILSADPIELIQILYEAALGSVEQARRHLQEGEIAARSMEISQACAILAELSLSVKHDTDPSLAGNLVELYDYMQRRLIEANVNQIEAPLAEVSRLLSTLLEGWSGCRPAPETAPAEPTASEDQLEYVGQSWTA
jgi:flagellar protein FliS